MHDFCTWKSCGFASFSLLALRSGTLKTTLTFMWGIAWLLCWRAAGRLHSHVGAQQTAGKSWHKSCRGHCHAVTLNTRLAVPCRAAPSGCPWQAGTQHQGLLACSSRAHGGRVPSTASQNLFFLQPGLWLHYSKADHEHRQPNLQRWGGGAGEVAEPISAIRTLDIHYCLSFIFISFFLHSIFWWSCILRHVQFKFMKHYTSSCLSNIFLWFVFCYSNHLTCVLSLLI